MDCQDSGQAMNRAELARSALYSQAIADAVGNPFEFGDPTQADVRCFMESDKPLRITDDTQMAMFGMEALILSAPSKFQDIQEQLQSAYLRWYVTQRHPYSAVGETGLLAEATMYRVEAPGNTCLDALEDLRNGREVRNDSKGCGCVMRLLPFALMHLRMPPDSLQSIAAISGAITHQHAEVQEAVSVYMTAAMEMIQHRALQTIPDGLQSAEHITDFGTGWTAMSCVQMAMWAAYHAKSFDELLTLSICHEGDSDSVAAVAGSLWGLAGRSGWEKYHARLEQQSAIDRLLERWGDLLDRSECIDCSEATAQVF